MYQIYADLRDKLGLTDYAVAKQTGIPAATFTRWKQGISKPNFYKIRKLSEFFGVPMEVFVEEVTA